jgi:CheY-like chemotaxis protein
MARRGRVRNADPNLSRVALKKTDVAPLAAFLRSLNEDYREVRGVRNLAARRLLWTAPRGGPASVIAALSRQEVQVTTVSSSEAAAAQAAQGNFSWVVIDWRGQGASHDAALRQAIGKLRARHVEMPIVIFTDSSLPPQLTRDAVHLGLTLAASPQALLSDLIAVQRRD